MVSHLNKDYFPTNRVPLALTLLLPQLPKCWDYRCVLSCYQVTSPVWGARMNPEMAVWSSVVEFKGFYGHLVSFT